MTIKVLFTAEWVRSLPLAADRLRVEYRDTNVPNLVLRVGTLTKTYYVFARGRTKAGKSAEKKVKLGDARLLTPQGARRLARSHLGVDDSSRAMPAAIRVRMDDQLLTTAEASRLTGMSIAWFERERWKGEGPPFYRAGRAVRYLKSELFEWWAARRA